MLNEITLIGRVTHDFIFEEKNGKKIAKNTLAISRSFKNKDGVYETDFIPFTLFNQMAVSSSEYVKKGDLIGIKGSLNCYKNNLQINVEKISFLSSNIKKEEKNEEIDKKL